MEDILFFCVASFAIAVIQWLLGLAIAYTYCEGNTSLGSILSAAFIGIAGSVINAAAKLEVWQGEIAQQYAHMDMSEIIKQNETMAYIGQMAMSKFGMPTLVAAIALNLILWIIFNHWYRLYNFLGSRDS